MFLSEKYKNTLLLCEWHDLKQERKKENHQINTNKDASVKVLAHDDFNSCPQPKKKKKSINLCQISLAWMATWIFFFLNMVFLNNVTEYARVNTFIIMYHYSQ